MEKTNFLFTVFIILLIIILFVYIRDFFINKKKCLDITKKYENEEIELLILLNDAFISTSKITNKYEDTTFNIIAAIDLKNNDLIEKKAKMIYISNKKDKFKFKKNTIYHIKCKKLKKEYDKERNYTYLITNVVEENIKNEQLEIYSKEFNKPLTINIPSIGEVEFKLILDDTYTTEILKNNNKCLISLETDSTNLLNVDNSKREFLKLYEKIDEFDMKAKKFAANQLIDIANDWYYDYKEDNDIDSDDTITLDDFINRMSLYEIYISNSGSYCLSYYDGDLFMGHDIYVEGKNINTIDDSNIR